MSFAGTDRNAGTDTPTDRESEKWKPLSLIHTGVMKS